VVKDATPIMFVVFLASTLENAKNATHRATRPILPASAANNNLYRVHKALHMNIFVKAQKYVPTWITSAFTRRVCSRLGKTKKHAHKLRFAKTYNIKWRQARKCRNATTLDRCVNRFETLNDLFARKISQRYTKPSSTNPTTLISPAEAYVRKVDATETFHIKKVDYTLTTLLKQKNAPHTSHVFVFRLAPNQYHRFHSPTSSTVTEMRHIQGAYTNVQLMGALPVLQENERTVLKFKNGIILVAVGATCVGSIRINVKKGAKVQHGDELGFFEFGGSCIVLIVPQHVRTRITAKESLIQTGAWLAAF